MIAKSHDQADRMWDAAVVGAGLAGSLVADRLRRAGASVIILESGPRRMDWAPDLKARAGRWPGPVLWRRNAKATARQAPAVVGHGPGGSSALYGGALERMRDADFSGTRPASPGTLDTAWPVDAAEMAPWYDMAEARFGVAGAREDGSSFGTLPAICQRDSALADVLKGNGLHPYRLPVAISYRTGCYECQGVRCERRCKGEGWTSVLSNLAESADFQTIFGAHVQSAKAERDGSVVVTLDDGTRSIRARRLILAAGALNTPRILMTSPDLFEGAAHPMIGRGLMFHVSDLLTVATPSDLKIDGPKKTLALRDFYDLSSGRGGELQSLGFDLSARLVSRYLGELLTARGVPGGKALMMAMRIPGAIAAARMGRQPVFATVLEDLPYAENRIRLGDQGHVPDASIEIEYQISDELTARWREMRRVLSKAFSPMKVTFLLRTLAPNLGHPCGTVRMGADPALAPADASGRIRGAAAPVFVADASAFPSSGGTNPSLTVAANALRIADGIARELESADAA